MERKMISCWKGLAPVSIPEDWLENFEGNKGFAHVGGEARIRFAGHGSYGISVTQDGPDVHRHVRRLTEVEEQTTPWGGFCVPWESYEVAGLFGHGPVTALDQIGN